MNPQMMTVLIPSLEPDDRLLPYVQSLLDKGFAHVVVVDDGSGPAYQPIFAQMATLPGCRVLHHEVNRGKGCALKTGYRYLMDELPDSQGVITADADGQHTLKDVWALAEQLAAGQDVLILGSRDFSKPDVPKKSRSGNRITTFIFWLLYGRWLPDTQTGLRGFAKSYLPFMAQVDGERYEYEMNVLIECTRSKIVITTPTIDTVYENENKGSHFHPLRDSWKIYRVILRGFFKYASASLICMGVDYLIAFLLIDVLRLSGVEPNLRLTLSTIGARLVSSVLNFMLNKTLVFKVKGGGAAVLLKYAALCIANIACISLFSTGLHLWLGISEKISYVVLSFVMYLVNFQINGRYIFKDNSAASARGDKHEK